MEGSWPKFKPAGPKRLPAGPGNPSCSWYDFRMCWNAFTSMSTGLKSSTSEKLSSSLSAHWIVGSILTVFYKKKWIKLIFIQKIH